MRATATSPNALVRLGSVRTVVNLPLFGGVLNFPPPTTWSQVLVTYTKIDQIRLDRMKIPI